MKKIAVLLCFLFVLCLQGCSKLALPKNEIATTPIPTVSTSPSALVCVDGKAAVLELDGNLTEIAPMYTIDRDSSVYRNGSKMYFIMKNMNLKSSLWVYDKGLQTLTCLMPVLQQTGLRTYIESFTVTNGEDYLYFKEDVFSIFSLFKSNSKERVHLYSIKNQQTITIPSFKKQKLLEIRPFQETDQFLIITTKAPIKLVYKWDINQKKTELITQFEADKYSISRDGKWLVALENNALIRYSLLDGQKEILQDDMSNADFAYVGNQSTLLVCRYSNPYETIINTMTPDKQWKAKILGEGNYVGFFAEINPAVVYFKAFNKESEEYKIILWYPDRDAFDIVFQSKRIELDDSCEISENGNQFLLKVQGSGSYHLFVNVEKKTCQISPEVFILKPNEASNDNSIWFDHNFDIDYNFNRKDLVQDVKEAKIKYFVYNSNENKKYPLKIDTRDYIFHAYATNNGDYIYMYLNEKERFYDVRKGDEITIPGLNKKNNLFTFITWLE